MTGPEKLAYKGSLKLFATGLMDQRVNAIRKQMDEAQEAANAEGKSSAGDKYETGRAMGHLQKDMYARQLAASQSEIAALQAIRTDILYSRATPGALVICEEIHFFLLAGLGKQVVNNQNVLFLSPQAPLARTLAGKKEGDQIEFMGSTRLIREIF